MIRCPLPQSSCISSRDRRYAGDVSCCFGLAVCVRLLWGGFLGVGGRFLHLAALSVLGCSGVVLLARGGGGSRA